MTRYAFAIDLDRCIGCHACTVACKAEHEIPLGVWRCWVKEVDRGVFPDTERIFLPVLCNQCEDAPCMEICPTNALFRRADGIVDLDGDACIGCRSCMAACPYHQLFIDPNTGTAEKCNFCANRLENGLAPACVVVCPTECRVFGDLDDEEDPLTRLLRENRVDVRRPEAGTGPKIFYLGAGRGDLDPLAAARAPMHRCADAGPEVPRGPVEAPRDPASKRPTVEEAYAGATPEARAFLEAVRRHPAGDVAPGRPTVSLDVFHRRPWGLDIAGYLVTKGIAAGAFGVGCATSLAGVLEGDLPRAVAPGIGLAFLLVTSALLVLDLERPERFLFLLQRPNPRSWLVRGAWCLSAFGALCLLALARRFLPLFDRIPDRPLLVAGLLAAAAAQVYSFFLFRQAARARELWGGWLRAPGLLIEGAVLGLGALLLSNLMSAGPPEQATLLAGFLAVSLVGHGAVLFLDLALHPEPGSRAALAASKIVRGEFALPFWTGGVALGIVGPLFLLVLGGGSIPSHAIGALAAMVGVFFWSRAWVYAGQSVPLA
ncbi:MAG TPA: 4Fe-4S dicluster domain-containing protein [Planctomycetota bacterium]|nr:4Fe-4S dicluster domain-containing protein [Planctomycetota bacterium]